MLSRLSQMLTGLLAPENNAVARGAA